VVRRRLGAPARQRHAQLLPLVGGEHVLHDWNVILLRWNLLHRDVALANGLRVLAWLGIAAALMFLVRKWRAAAA